MARTKKRVIEYIEPGADEGDVSRPPVVSDPAEDTYDAFVHQFAGEGVRVKVYRQTERGKQYCFWGAPSEVDEESIRLYHARQPYAHEQGIYIVQVDVHGEYRNSFTVPIAPQISTPGARSNGDGGENGLLLKMLMDQNARLEQRLLNGGNQEREPINALADAMLKLSQLQQTNAPQLPIETIMKAIELGKSLDGGGDWKTELLSVVKESMPAIQTILQTRGAAVGMQPAPVPTPIAAESEATMLQAQLKMGIDFLKRKCVAGSDAGLYIDWIIDNREVAPYAQLIHAVVTQPFSSFIQIDAEIGKPPYEAFFTALYDGLRSAFTEANPPHVDTGGQGGNAGNTKSHGASGAKRAK